LSFEDLSQQDRKKLFEYNFVVRLLPDMPDDEVRAIFQRVNKTVDFFTMPTIRFQLYVFLVLAYERRRVFHFNVTAHPTAEWTAQQLREAFPFEQLPRYLPLFAGFRE
jgi:hypothetical protein